MPDTEVTLTGFLRCRDAADAETVHRHLPAHIELTRAEPGCVSFAVEQTADPLVWAVAERFADRDAFSSHQERVAASEWGRATAGIPREYDVRG
ncbi:putative quinol monooxygenase [Microbacterium karelineae]|uniref:putative quinol monooxygenase n=1 Tax=Microbacterium karelineae TaxID=2654283 RepID=UPI0012E9CCAA|nr:antibiotic biosynthesis monooxygenase [Microbacterium karelineae]